ncbi:MAG: MFS transporter [Chloroflexi bacterium]|nr:MFS transporter [Chloroflexota bacterium]
MASLAAIGRNTLDRYVSALQYRDYRYMWMANLSAQAAYWALIVARGWLVFDMTHSPSMVGTVTFVAMAPMVFLPPISGVLADKMNRRTLLAWTYGVNLLHNLVLALLAISGILETWHILLLSLVNGSARAMQMPVSQALAANLVPREKLLNALSLNAATMHASRLVGPGLTAPLLAILGAPAAFFLCTAFYLVGWVQILKIKTVSTGGIKKGESFVVNFTDGIRYVWHHHTIRMITGMVILHCGLTMAFESLLPVFSTQRLGAGSAGFANLMVGVGAGALAGSILIGGVLSPFARGKFYLVTGILSGLGQVMLSFAPNMAVAVTAAAAMGASQAAFMTLGQATTQSLAADDFRGRLASINAFSLGGVMSTMNLVNGFLGNVYPVVLVLLVEGMIFVGIMLVGFALSTPRHVYLRGFPQIVDSQKVKLV